MQLKASAARKRSSCSRQGEHSGSAVSIPRTRRGPSLVCREVLAKAYHSLDRFPKGLVVWRHPAEASIHLFAFEIVHPIRHLITGPGFDDAAGLGFVNVVGLSFKFHFSFSSVSWLGWFSAFTLDMRLIWCLIWSGVSVCSRTIATRSPSPLRKATRVPL